MTEPLQPNQVVSVSLEAQQWNVVVGQLMEGQYKTMAPLIGTIVAQCGQAAQQLQPAVQPPANEGQVGPRLVIGEGSPPGYVKPNGTDDPIPPASA